MEIKKSNKVTKDNGLRPAGKPDECFYCGEKIGKIHKKDCVCRKKTVSVRYIYDIEIKIPQHWDEGNILYSRNDGSWSRIFLALN